MLRPLRILLTALIPTGFTAVAEESVNYEEHIKPIFREHCLKCHGDDEQKADLNLQTHAGALKGGSGGAVVVAGRASQSLLFQSTLIPRTMRGCRRRNR